VKTEKTFLQLAVNLKVPYDSLKQSGLTKDQAKELSTSDIAPIIFLPVRDHTISNPCCASIVKEAHKICPYSRAIAGNVETVIDLA
jgi:organic hydroperoxide reductase OsmC/OhrA